MLLFIYGTLKRNFSRAPAMQGQRFITETATAPMYRMVKVETYPGLIDAPDDGLPIEGELWEVNDEGLIRLDRIEGVDEGLYERRPIKLNDEAAAVQAYFFLGPTEGLQDCGTRW